MKKGFTEKAFREYLDQVNPKGIQSDHEWFKDAKDYQKKSNTTFRTEYNDWLDMNEKDGFNTGSYDVSNKIEKDIKKERFENSLKNFNEFHKTQLVYEIVNPNGTTNPKGLKIKNEGNSKSVECSKSKAIEILNFFGGLV